MTKFLPYHHSLLLRLLQQSSFSFLPQIFLDTLFESLTGFPFQLVHFLDVGAELLQLRCMLIES
jgi:hypothetical protein